MTKIYVISTNDFPKYFCYDEEEAQEFCNMKNEMEELRTKNLDRYRRVYYHTQPITRLPAKLQWPELDPYPRGQ